MRLDLTIKRFFRSIFRKKNMKYLLLILVILVGTFLMKGNYGLVLREGATFAQETAKMQQNIGEAYINSNSINGGANEAANNVDGFTFSMKEGLCSEPCDKIYSTLGVPSGSTATLDVCKAKRQLECENPS